MQHLSFLQVSTYSQIVVGRAGGRGRLLRLGVFSVWILSFFALTQPTYCQTISAKPPLQISTEGELATYWTVLEAGLRENINGTTGNLKVQNASSVPLEGAVFYAEYFDLAGRFCFSLIFSQDKSSDEQVPVAPGGISVIGADSSGLFPASEPKEVRLYLVQLKLPGLSNLPRKWDARLRAPVTISGGVHSALQLDAEVTSAKGAVLDLLLASISVNRAGVVTNVDVLHSTSSQVELWFRDFVQRQATLFPSTDRGVPQETKAFILVRAVLKELKEGDLQNLLLSPNTSPWVQSYLKNFTGDSVAPLTDLVFTRPTTQVNRLTSTGEIEVIKKPPAPANLFELGFQDSYWSSPAVGWVRDDSMPHHVRREIATAQPQ